MAALAIDFGTLLRGIPKGAWVAISENQERVVAYSADMHDVLEQARRLGEADPIILRVPESESALML